MRLLIDKEILLRDYFQKNSHSFLVCPICQKCTLKLDQDSFRTVIRKVGRECEREDILYDTWCKTHVFSCFLICIDDSCQESIVCSGAKKFDTYNCIETGKYEVFSIYYPKYFYPYLCLFKIPEKCPDSVKQAIEESFATFFSSITATTNSIRISIEALLREHEILSGDESGKFVSLHRKIENIPENSELYPFKEQLLTLKYMGNDGSHSESKVEKEDIVDAYEVLSDVLDKLYSEKKDVSITIKRLNDKFSKK
ncbi:unnamed protein product [Commensalibacter communis]|uniref:DUF4145 domain-containing protein n=1 Tax=Commensalibacter communis TaxID=2972786 RepID=UPI0022FF7307|nr:DUF4145 domain-containing protein [Commensalibacter communis]CAI3924817.1 unnamed protein product [Commensalibacter communis]CAI3934543.1 unnamed protein product [Commensalibacter communis]